MKKYIPTNPVIYSHHNSDDINPKHTLCIEVPPKTDIQRWLDRENIDQVGINLGVAYTSKHDNYNKKIGRMVSKGRMEPRVLDVVNVQKIGKEVHLFLQEPVDFTIKIDKDTLGIMIY